MIPDARLLRGSGMARVTSPDYAGKTYAYRGIPGWNPAALGPMPTPAQEREARHARFAEFRASGLGVRAAARAAGLKDESGSWYERQRKRRRAPGVPDADGVQPPREGT